jgi:histidyl-tRNA synthetase
MDIKTVKGFADFVGADALKRERMKDIIRRQFELYGFEPAETPIIEGRDFVVGDNKEDGAVRDVFKLEDRGERKLALRYEFTFQLKRIAKNQKLPFKRYQIGSIFRDEPIRKGRLRQFVQCDADVIGSSLKTEAEVLSMGKKVFDELGIPAKIYVNNRKLINEILVSEGVEEKNREQVIRELDKLDKLSKKEVADNLKSLGAESVLKVFTGKEVDFEKYNYYKEIVELKEYCKMYGVDVEFRPYLARGFSYYRGTVFEFWGEELKVSLCGGGNFLVDDVESFGISFGLEPLFLISNIEGEGVEYAVVSIGQDDAAIKLASDLRAKGKSVSLILDKAVGKAMDYANSKGIGKVVCVGKSEVESGKFKEKDMGLGEEVELIV